jgi:hypothetical protein
MRPWLFGVLGVVCLLVGIAIVSRVSRSISPSAVSPSAQPQPRYGDSRSVFDAFYGGQSSLGDGYYHNCVPKVGQITTAIPSMRVVFTTSGNASSISWQPCANDPAPSWRDAAKPFLPVDAHLLQSQPGTQDVEIDVYTSPAAGMATGNPIFTLAGGPGLNFTLTSGNALTP